MKTVKREMQIPEYITLTEAAEMLRVSKVTIHSWINKELFKAYKIGRRTLLIKQEVLASISTRVPK